RGVELSVPDLLLSLREIGIGSRLLRAQRHREEDRRGEPERSCPHHWTGSRGKFYGEYPSASRASACAGRQAGQRRARGGVRAEALPPRINKNPPRCRVEK